MRDKKEKAVKTDQGLFVFKRPTTGEALKVSITDAKLRQGYYLDPVGASISYMAAYLTVCTVSAPEGWPKYEDGTYRFDEMDDAQDLMALHKEAVAVADSFRKVVQGEQEETSAR